MTSPLTPETLVYGFTAASDPQVSPDGTRVAYVLGRTDRETRKPSSAIWLCDIDGANKRRLTFGGVRNGNPRWSPDGQSLAFTSDRVEPNGVFILPMDGGEARELLRHPTAVGDLAWSPDGSRLAFTAPFDPANPEGKARAAGEPAPIRVTSRIDYKQDNRGYLHDTRIHVYTADLATGATVRLSSEAKDHGSPAWSPDGRSLLCRVSYDNGFASGLVLLQAEGGDARPVTAPDARVSTWAWSADGAAVLYTADPDHTTQPDFYLYDLGTGSTRRLTDDLQCLPDGGFPTIVPPSMPVFLDDSHALFHAFRAGASGLFTIDLRDGAVVQVEGEQELRAGLSADRSRRYIAQSIASLEKTGEVGVIDRQEGRRTLITEYSAPVLSVSPAAAWERFEVRRDGLATEAWLLRPADFDPAKRYPLVLDVHGGPNGHYGYTFNAMQQALATNGFITVFSNPRGSSSYGRDFAMRVFGDWGGEDYADLMAVVDTCLERPYIDRDRTGIWGYSYGGYMTAWTISQTRRFKAAVCGAPCFDLESMYGTSDISHVFGPLQWTGAPHEAREWYATHSPSQFAHNTRTPTLIIQGEADERCPVGQGEQMFVTLKQNGCEVEFARYPGQSHLFMRTGPAEYREDVLARTLAWFKRHLGEPR